MSRKKHYYRKKRRKRTVPVLLALVVLILGIAGYGNGQDDSISSALPLLTLPPVQRYRLPTHLRTLQKI